MKTRLLWTLTVIVLCAVVVAALATGCARKPPATQAEKEPYRIGAMFAVTGPASPLGEPERNTAQLLERQINAAGGIDGHPLEILIEDTAGEDTRAVMAANKFIDQNVLAVVGPSRSSTTLAILETLQKAEVPLISCAASVKITQPAADRKWVFKTPQSDAHAIDKLIEYMQANDMKRVGFIFVANAFGESGREQAEALLPEAGIEIVAKETFGQEDTVMTTQVTNLAKAKPDAIICWGTNPGPARIAAAMYDMKVDIPLLQSHGVANRSFIELAGAGGDGVVLPAGRLIVAEQIPDADPQKQTLLEYAKAYEDEFGKPADTFGGHAWDAIQLVVKALREGSPGAAGSAGSDVEALRAQIRDSIEQTTGFVGIGGVFDFSPQDHNGLTRDAFVMVRIEDGEWTLIQ